MSRNRALILDRDGIILRETGNYLPDISQMEFVDGIFEVLRRLSNHFLIFIVTNQAGISKGITPFTEYLRMEAVLESTMQQHGIPIVATFFCPHHPTITKCFCRKPSTLFIERIIHLWNVEPCSSFAIGDRFKDIMGPLSLGFKIVMVPSNTPAYLWEKLIENPEE